MSELMERPVDSSQYINLCYYITSLIDKCKRSNTSSFMLNSLNRLYQILNEFPSNTRPFTFLPPQMNYLPIYPTIETESESDNSDKKTENFEKQRVKERLGNFNWKESLAWNYLSSTYGDGLNQKKLLSIAQNCSSSLNISLDRDAKRRKSVLIKWFDDNWNIFEPFLQNLIRSQWSVPTKKY